MVRKSNSGPVRLGRDRRLRRAETRRREILAAAARVFRERGVANAGMREIADEADLSPANLYHYFEGKPEILYWCQDRALDLLLDALKQARRTDAPAADRIRCLFAAHVRCLLDEMQGATAHLEVEALRRPLRDRIVTKRDRYEKGIRTLVAEGVREGAFAPCDPDLVTRAALGALNWTTRWYRPGGPRSVAEIADELAGYLLRGLVAGSAATTTARPSLRRAAPHGGRT